MNLNWEVFELPNRKNNTINSTKDLENAYSLSRTGGTFQRDDYCLLRRQDVQR